MVRSAIPSWRRILVYARTSDDRSKGISFWSKKGSQASLLGQKIKDKLGMRASTTAELVFTDCRIPAGNWLDMKATQFST